MKKIEINVLTGEEIIRDFTPEEVEEIQKSLSSFPTLEEQKINRKTDYIMEADPLFFKYQAGEVTKEEWLAKREEIRQRYPYPS